jgi:Dolichyl-phosphate-mannose-protein mannosyltransferase
MEDTHPMIINAPDIVIEPRSSKKSSQNHLILLAGLFSFCFFAAFLRLASKPLWMDEVLAVWVIRLPSARDVISALYHGAEFSPPTYHLLLHALATVAGSSYRVLRIPSILAILVSGLCIFALLRRHFGLPAAAFGLMFSLLGLLSSFALEIRPYALVVPCFAVSVLLWDRLDGNRGDFWRVCLITLCLAFATSLHFYAVLFVPCIATIEALWSVHHRRLRIPVWLGLLVAGGSSLAWLPLIKALGHYNAGDSGNPNYYARPIPGRLMETYSAVFIYDKKQVLFLFVTVCLLAAAYALNKVRTSAKAVPEPSHSWQGTSGITPYIIAFCTVAFPLLVFLFAIAVTKTFNTRYCIVACLGSALLVASILSRMPAFHLITTPLLLAGCILTFLRSVPAGVLPNTPEIADILADATKPYPIAVDEGLQYFQLQEGLPDQLKSRLVYVTTPAGVTNPEPTNENQVKRWIPLRPDLKVMSADVFLAQNPHFYFLHTTESNNALTDWLLRKGMIEKVDEYSGHTWLFEAGSGK